MASLSFDSLSNSVAVLEKEEAFVESDKVSCFFSFVVVITEDDDNDDDEESIDERAFV